MLNTTASKCWLWESAITQIAVAQEGRHVREVVWKREPEDQGLRISMKPWGFSLKLSFFL